MTDYLLDTCVVIDHLRGNSEVVEFLSDLTEQGTLACSVLTVAEVCSGVREEEAELTRLFFEAVVLYNVDAECSVMAGNYHREWHKSHGTGLIDALLAATASRNNCTLVTADLSHYPMNDIRTIPPPASSPRTLR